MLQGFVAMLSPKFFSRTSQILGPLGSFYFYQWVVVPLFTALGLQQDILVFYHESVVSVARHDQDWFVWFEADLLGVCGYRGFSNILLNGMTASQCVIPVNKRLLGMLTGMVGHIAVWAVQSRQSSVW